MNEPEKTDGRLNILATEIKQLIAQSRSRVAMQVNSATTMLYWKIGKRIFYTHCVQN